MEFSVVYSGQMELHFFALRKWNRLNHIICSEVSVTRGLWSGYVSTRNMVADDLENDCLKKDDNFMFLAAAASIFARRNLNQSLGYFEQMIVTNCGNWRGIILMPTAAKVNGKVIIKRISRGVDKKLRKEQAGFRSGRSTMGNSRKYPYPTTDGFHVLTPPCPPPLPPFDLATAL